MNNDALAIAIHQWVIIILFGALAVISGIMCFALGVTWVVTNVIRAIIGLVNHIKHKSAPKITEIKSENPYTKLDVDIHIKTNDNKLADSIRNLSDCFSKDKQVK